MVGDGAFKITWTSTNKQRNEVGRSRRLVGVDTSRQLRKVQRVVQRYYLTAPEAFQLFGVGTINRAGSVPVVEDWTAERMVIEVAGQTTDDRPNPYGWIPYVIFPNQPRPHELWGDSDLVDLIDTCRELNRRLTASSRILQVSGNPIAVLENITGSAVSTSTPARYGRSPKEQGLPARHAVGRRCSSAHRLHRSAVPSLYDLAETPRTAFGDSGRNVSGAALEVEIQPLVQKVQRRRRVWDAVYRQRNSMILDLLERFGNEPLGGVRRSEVVWGWVLPNDRQALVLDEVQLVAQNIHSRRTAMNLLGDVDQEREVGLIKEEQTMGLAPQAASAGANAHDASSRRRRGYRQGWLAVPKHLSTRKFDEARNDVMCTHAQEPLLRVGSGSSAWEDVEQVSGVGVRYRAHGRRVHRRNRADRRDEYERE